MMFTCNTIYNRARPNCHDNCFFIDAGKRFFNICFTGILYIEACRNYVRIVTNATMCIANLPEFDRKLNQGTPEHLLLNAISNSFMTTYFTSAKKLHADILYSECDTIGQIEIINGRYKMTNINVYSTVLIENETLRVQLNLACEKAQKIISFLIINTPVLYHIEILINQYPLYEKLKNRIRLKTGFLSTKRKDIGTRFGIDFENSTRN